MARTKVTALKKRSYCKVRSIEKIMKQRKKGNKAEYLVKWKGYDSSWNSWVSLDDFRHYIEMVDDFNRKSQQSVSDHAHEVGADKTHEYEASGSQYCPFWPIEKIIQQREKGNKAEYLVEWKGYESRWNSWETLDDYRHYIEMVDDFNRKSQQGDLDGTHEVAAEDDSEEAHQILAARKLDGKASAKPELRRITGMQFPRPRIRRQTSCNVWPIEKIIEKRKRGNKAEYRVKWEKYYSTWNSWETLDDFRHYIEMVEDFNRKSQQSDSSRTHDVDAVKTHEYEATRSALCPFWLIEKIIQQREKGNKAEYLVKWKGYESSRNSWETLDDYRHYIEMVDDFNRKSQQGDLDGTHEVDAGGDSDESTEDDSDESDEEDTEEGHQILAARVINGKAQYLVKWEGYDDDDNTWEPAEDVSPKLIEKYQASADSKPNVAKQEQPSAAGDENGNKNGFGRGLAPEKILDITACDTLVLMKWKMAELSDWVKIEDARKVCPQIVIDFLMARGSNASTK